MDLGAEMADALLVDDVIQQSVDLVVDKEKEDGEAEENEGEKKKEEEKEKNKE